MQSPIAHSLIALADPTRRRMVELLAGREMSAGKIGEEFEISAPAVSQHLKVLKDASIVRVRVEGQRRIYALEPDGFAELESWLSQVTRFWTGKLDALERQMQRHKAGENAVKQTQAKRKSPKPKGK